MKIKNKATRAISLLLALLMLFGAMPLSVFAEEIGNITDESEQNNLNQQNDILNSLVQPSGDESLPSSNEGLESPELSESDNKPVGEIEVSEDAFQMRLNQDGKSYTVVGYLSTSDTMDIPAAYVGVNGEFPVTRIEEFAFQNKTKLKYVSIPDSVEYIGTEAFSGCDSLVFTQYENANYLGNASNPYLYLHSATDTNISSVTIYDGAVDSKYTRFIGSYAFQNCINITSIIVPETVQQIGFKAFRHTDSLTSITLPFVGETGAGSENTHFGYIFGAQTYGGNISYVPESLTDVVIMGGARIAKNSFYGVDMITTLSLPYVGESINNPKLTHIGFLFGYDTYEENILLPEKLSKIIVQSGTIYDYAFYNCSNLKQVMLEEDVDSIGTFSFAYCTSLTNFTFANGSRVSYIGDSAFYGCDTLFNIKIPSNVVRIGDSAFAYCERLISLTFEENSQLTEIGERAFFYNRYLSSEIIIPENVVSIGKSAFYQCDRISKVTFLGMDSIKEIPEFVFSFCYNLSIISIPESVEIIGYCAFQSCSSLKSFNLPAKVKAIDNGAFSNCSKLATFTFSDGSQLESIDSGVFRACTSLTSINLPSTLKTLGEETFSGCTALSEIAIPSQITTLSKKLFYGCKNLKKVTFESNNTLTSISDNAFYNCTSLESIEIPISVKSIGESSFTGCNAIKQNVNGVIYVSNWVIDCDTTVTEVSIREGTISISKSAFSDCSSLASVVIPDSVTIIGDLAFNNCTNLVSVFFSDNSQLRSIGSNAFKNCRNLAGITLPSNLEIIGGSAFYNCNSITSLVMPTSVKTVGTYAFYGCNISEVHTTDLSSWCSINFSANYSNPLYSAKKLYVNGELLTSLIIPSDVTYIGDYSFCNCTSIVSVDFTNANILSVGQNAFYGCSYIKSVNVDSIEKWLSIKFSNDTANPTNLSKKLYLNNELITDLTISDGIVGIPDYAFINCVSITSVSFPDTLTSVGRYSFSGCNKLSNIEFPQALQSIGHYAFSACGFTTIELHSNITTIGTGAFYRCTKLKTVELPAYITKISPAMFQDCYALEQVSIPENVTSIGDSAFYNCNLIEIVIPNGVTIIDAAAFRACTDLKGIILPETLKTIGASAFYDCISLTSIEIPIGVISIGNYAFYNCSKLTIYCQAVEKPLGWSETWNPSSRSVIWEYGIDDLPETESPYSEGLSYSLNADGLSYTVDGIGTCVDTVIIIPSTYNQLPVTSIGVNAFEDTDIVCVEIPFGVTSIESGAFNDCWSLEIIKIPSSINRIDSEFYMCSPSQVHIDDIASWCEIDFKYEGSNILSSYSKLYLNGQVVTDVVIPDTVTSINRYAFCNYANLNSVIIPSSVKTIGASAFSECTGLNNVVLPYELTSIEARAFYNCSALATIELPDTLNNIGSSAFDGCSNIIQTIDNVSYVGAWVVDSNTSVTSITLRDNTKGISAYAFSGCKQLATIVCPSTLKYIGSSSFYNCSSLTSITIPDGVVTIGASAFYKCTGLTSVIIPSSVESIGASAFEGCSELLSLNFDSNCKIEKINEKTFYGCKKLVNIEIPSQVKVIGKSAFGGCSLLESVIIPQSVIEIGESTFGGCNQIIELTIPASIITIGRQAFINCQNLTSIYFATGSQLSLIEESAFAACYKLQNVYIGDINFWLGIEFEDDESNPLYRATNLYVNNTLLTDLTIPNGIQTINDYAFYGYTSLKSIWIPNTIQQIGQYSFSKCASLTQVTYDGELNEWRFVVKATNWTEGTDNYKLKHNNSQGLLYEMSEQADEFYVSEFDPHMLPVEMQSDSISIVVPETFGNRPVIKIFKNAFYDCDQLKEIHISETISFIGAYAFANCDQLQIINIPIAVSHMDKGLFAGCNNLQELSIPFVGNNRYDENAFLGYLFGAFDYSVNGTYIPLTLKTVNVLGDANIANYAFYECSSLLNVNLMGNPERIGDYAFAYCRKLSDFSMPNSVVSVGENILLECNSIENIYLGASLSEIDDNITQNGLWGINKAISSLSEYIVSIDNAKYAADDFGVLYEKMEIPYNSGSMYVLTSVVDAPSNANLATYAFPEHIVEISPYAFAYNNTIATIDLEYIRMIGDYAFYEANNLISVTFGIPATIDSEFWDYVETISYSQYIGDYAFMGCSSLQKINIETDMIIGIGEQAFFDCEKLKTIWFGENLQEIGLLAFGSSQSGVSNLEQFFVDPDNNKFTSIGGVLYQNNDDATLTLIWYPACLVQLETETDESGNVVGQNILTIDGKKINVKDFILPKTEDDGRTPVAISAIESYAFQSARYLERLVIEGDTSLAVGDYAFSGSAIQTIEVGTNVTTLGLKRGEGEYTVFADCLYLTEINVSEDNPYYSSQNGVLFDKKQTKLIKYPVSKVGTTYDVPVTVSSIASMAFKRNPSLLAVRIPSYVSTIGLEAFYQCTNLAVIYFDNVYAPNSIMENALTTYYEPSTIIGYSEAKYLDGATANELGWNNYESVYTIQAMSAMPDIKPSENNGAYAIVIVDEEGNRVNGLINENGKSNFIVTLTDPNGVSETVYTGKDENGLGDGVATFYDLYGSVSLGFSIDFEQPYTLRISDTSGTYYTFVSEDFYLDYDMRITYITLVRKPCDIVFNANGGTTEISSIPLNIGEITTLPNNKVYRDGYTLLGWSLSADGQIEYTDSFYANKYKDHFVLYAIWEANTNSLKFDKNGGTGIISEISVQTDETIVLPNNLFIRDGYTFAGWSLSSNGSVVYADVGSYTSGPASETTLYAKWTANDTTLILLPNGGDGIMEEVVVKTDETIALPKNMYDRNGYTFVGWLGEDGTEYGDQTDYTASAKPIQTLSAIWIANENTISFNSNGGIGTMSSIVANTDALITLPKNEFTRSGYILLGWSASENGALVCGNMGSYTVGTENSQTLYAVWAKGATIYGLNCDDADINTETVTINQAQYGKNYESIELIDPAKGYVDGNIRLVGASSEKIRISAICYYDVSYLDVINSTCALYQNGQAIKGCTLVDIKYNEDSCTVYFEVPIDELVAEVPVEIRIGITNGSDSIVSTAFLNIDVINFVIDESDINLNSSDLSVDLSQGGDMIEKLLGGGEWTFNLSDDIKFSTIVDGNTVTLSLNAEYEKKKSNKENYGDNYQAGYEANRGEHNKNTWFFQKTGVVLDENNYPHVYTMNIRFARGTEDSGYYYYRCYIYEGSYSNQKVLFYGAVYAPRGRSDCGIKANLICLSYFEEANEKKDITKGHKYLEPVSQIVADLWSEITETHKYKFNTVLYGDIVFQYESGKGLVPVTSEIKGELHYTFEHDQQFVVWVIPIYLQINVGIDGEVSLKLAYDEWRSVSIDEAKLKIEAEIAAKVGVGCKLLSAGVEGTIGTVFILEFAPDFGIEEWTVNGKLSLYAQFYTIKWKKKWWGGYPVIKQTTKYHDLWSGSSTIIGSKETIATAEEGSVLMAAMFLAENYEPADPLECAEEATLFMIDGELYKLYFVNMIGKAEDPDTHEYDEYNYRKLALAKWENNAWNIVTVIDDNGLNDLDYTLYKTESGMALVYTQHSDKMTEETTSDTYDYVRDLVIKYVLIDEIKSEYVPLVVCEGGNYKYLSTTTTVNSIPTVVWAENADNNMFGVSPYNYMTVENEEADYVDAEENSTITSHIFATTANSIWMSQYVNGEWTTPVCLVSGLSAVTNIAVTSDGTIAYIIDENGDLANVEDRVMYTITLAGDKGESSEAGTILSVNANNKGFLYSCDSNDFNGLMYGNKEANAELPTDTSMLPEKHELVYNEHGVLTAIIWAENKSWSIGDDKFDGSTLYAMFKENGVWGSTVELTTDIIFPTDKRYISSLDAIMNGDNIVLHVEYTENEVVDQDVSTVYTAFTDTIILSPSVLVENATIDYTESLLNVNLKNIGSKSTAVYAQIVTESGTYKITVCELLNSGERKNVSIDISGYGMVFTVELFDSENTFVYSEDVDLNHSDLQPFVKQLLLGNDNTLLVAVRNDGNSATGGILHIAVGNYSIDKLKDVSITKTIEMLGAGKIVYFEIPLSEEMKVDENTIITLYVESLGSLEKGNCKDNNLLYDSLQSYTSTVADDGTSYKPTIDIYKLTYDKYAPVELVIGYNCSNTNGIQSISVDGVVVSTEIQYAIINNQIVLNQSYLDTLEQGYHDVVISFKDETTFEVQLYVVEYFKITWLNEFGSVIQEDMVAKGTIPNCDSIPTKDSTNTTVYNFAGWDYNGDNVPDSISRVSGAISYTVVWRESSRNYTITWVFQSDDGNVSIEEVYAYGCTPIYAGKAIQPTTKTFVSWNETPSVVSQDATYYAVYEKNVKGSANITNSAFEVAPGKPFTTTVMLENVVNMTESTITVTFDKTVVSFSNIILRDNVKCVEQGDDYVIVIATDLASGTVNELFDITFNVKEGVVAGEHSIFTITSEDQITNVLDNAIVYQDGDVSGDGVVNTRDLAILRQYVVGKIELTDVQLYYANFYEDTNVDGTPKINTRDLAMLQQYIVGISSN